MRFVFAMAGAIVGAIVAITVTAIAMGDDAPAPWSCDTSGLRNCERTLERCAYSAGLLKGDDEPPRFRDGVCERRDVAYCRADENACNATVEACERLSTPPPGCQPLR